MTDEIYKCEHYPPIPVDIAEQIISCLADVLGHITSTADKLHENGKDWAFKQTVEMVFMVYVLHTLEKKNGTLAQAVDEILDIIVCHSLPKIIEITPTDKLGDNFGRVRIQAVEELTSILEDIMSGNETRH